MEARGQVVTVEELARLRLNGAERGTGTTANESVADTSNTQRTVLLSLGAICREGVGQSTGGRGRVNSWSVVNGGWRIMMLELRIPLTG